MGLYYLLELGLSTLLPMIAFAYGVRHRRVGLVRWGALLAVAGIVWNRLNTVLVCYNYRLHQEIPHWKELWVVLTILAIYFIFYRFFLYRIPVLFRWPD